MRMLLAVALTFVCLAATSPESFAAGPESGSMSTRSDSSRLDLRRFALSISQGGGTDYEQAVRALDWLSHNFKWLATDYKQRTVREIIERKGGNCFELATVYMALIKTLGIKYRQVAEINIQPESERRQKNAEELVAKRGFAGSVFGAGHNDHRWVEIYNERNGKWIPADPSVGVIGLEPWLKSRVWFGTRWAIDTSITNDMIVPIAIFTTDSTYTMKESRTRFYLVTAFNDLYGGRLAGLPSWGRWVTEIDSMGEHCRGAFDGKVNLHRYRADIARIGSTYAKLRTEWEEQVQKR
jgi:hypothetical protein